MRSQCVVMTPSALKAIGDQWQLECSSSSSTALNGLPSLLLELSEGRC